MSIVTELREERATAIKACRDMNDKAEAEGRDFTGEDQKAYDDAWKRQGDLENRIKREESLIAIERENAANLLKNTPAGGDGGSINDGKPTADAIMKAYGAALVSGLHDMPRISNDQLGILKAALSQGIGTEGGYLSPPEEFVNQLIQKVDDEVFIRQHATVHTLMNSDTLGIPTLDTDPDDAEWTSEIATGSEDSSMAFGKRELKPAPLAKRIKVSKKLLRTSALPVANIVMERMAHKQAIPQEKGFLLGTGAGQPLGVYTASTDGISTGRDVLTGSATTFTFDGLKNAKYSLKAPYLRNARWNLHRDGVAIIAKLKDGDGRYLWQDSVVENEPDRLLGLPVDMSEFTPNTFTTGLYVGMLADFSHYWIAQSLAIEIQRLDELYAETNQIGYITRSEVDGMPVLEEAFARLITD